MVCWRLWLTASGIFPQTQAHERGNSKSLEAGKDLAAKVSLRASKAKAKGDQLGAQGVAQCILGMAPSQNSMAELAQHQGSVAFPNLGEQVLVGKILQNEQKLENIPLFERLRLRIK